MSIGSVTACGSEPKSAAVTEFEAIIARDEVGVLSRSYLCDTYVTYGADETYRTVMNHMEGSPLTRAEFGPVVENMCADWQAATTTLRPQKTIADWEAAWNAATGDDRVTVCTMFNDEPAGARAFWEDEMQAEWKEAITFDEWRTFMESEC